MEDWLWVIVVLLGLGGIIIVIVIISFVLSPHAAGKIIVLRRRR